MARRVRKQVRLTLEQCAWLVRKAAQEHQSQAAIVRSTLDARILHEQTRKNEQTRKFPFWRDSLWEIVGLGTSGRTDVSESVDRHLYGHRD
jgi:hypothetical protein